MELRFGTPVQLLRDWLHLFGDSCCDDHYYLFYDKNGQKIKLSIEKQKVQEIKVENVDAAFKVEEDMSTTSYLRSTRRTVLEALMYILAFFLTWVFEASDVISPGSDAQYLSVLKLICRPLQSLWNMFIFLYHKIWLVRNFKL
jgi:hypothetical protein